VQIGLGADRVYSADRGVRSVTPALYNACAKQSATPGS
jgi:hypothetical protein